MCVTNTMQQNNTLLPNSCVYHTKNSTASCNKLGKAYTVNQDLRQACISCYCYSNYARDLTAQLGLRKHNYPTDR